MAQPLADQLQQADSVWEQSRYEMAAAISDMRTLLDQIEALVTSPGQDTLAQVASLVGALKQCVIRLAHQFTTLWCAEDVSDMLLGPDGSQ